MHIVEITSQPAERNLPSELVNALDNMGYHQIIKPKAQTDTLPAYNPS